ncbi:MAG: Na+/H+ antiporter NhaC family protein [Gammaproteobacteria bacterium]|jgi:Na+/H+ antiporter NhaC
MSVTWYSLLPPILAITIAIWRRNIILALLVSLLLAETLLSGFNPFVGLLALFERIVDVFSDPDRTRVLLFSLLVGSLLALFRTSGGVNAFVHQLTCVGFATTKRRAALLPSITGTLIFIETNLSILTAGIISQKLFDKFKLSRAQLAYIIDSTCSPISVLILLNGWGAYILGLLEGYGLENTTSTLIQSIGLNFYPIIAVIMVYFTAITGKVFGPMKQGHSRIDLPTTDFTDDAPASKSRYFLIPLLTLVAGMPLFMLYTGDGHLLQGSGTKAVLWSVGLALIVCAVLLYQGKQMSTKTLIENSFTGMNDLLPLVTIVLLSMGLGMACIDLGTGQYVALFVGDFLPPFLLAPILFLCAGIISFTTGTSWGTFAIMMPLGIPLAMTLGVPPALVLAAILGGGVFGDHCSPISDSTLMASLASGCDHLEHVRTQLPYALVMAAVSLGLYLLIGFYL